MTIDVRRNLGFKSPVITRHPTINHFLNGLVYIIGGFLIIHVSNISFNFIVTGSILFKLFVHNSLSFL